MILRFLVLVVLFLHQDPPNSIIWNSNYPLKWVDYQSRPDNNSPHSAISHCGLSVGYEKKEDSLFISVVAYFDKSKSWIKPDKARDNLLLHEQGHFDIAELYARKIRLELKNTVLDKDDYQRIIQSVIQNNLSLYNTFQKSYDITTSYSKDEDEQRKWSIQIKQSLDSLSGWQEEIVINILKKD